MPPGTNLKRTFAAAMIEHIDAGWTMQNFSSTSGAFFCEKEGQRRQVAVIQLEPGTEPPPGAAHLVWSPTGSKD